MPVSRLGSRPAASNAGCQFRSLNVERFSAPPHVVVNTIGMALGRHGRSDDSSGPPIPGLCHVSMLFVDPTRWGEGIGTLLVHAFANEAASLGYNHRQLTRSMPNCAIGRSGAAHAVHGPPPSGDDCGRHLRRHPRTAGRPGRCTQPDYSSSCAPCAAKMARIRSGPRSVLA